MKQLIKLAALAAIMCACMLTCNAQCGWAKPKVKAVKVKTVRASRVPSQAIVPWHGNKPSRKSRRHARRLRGRQ